MTADVIDTPAKADRLMSRGNRDSFFGEPKVLGYLAFTEAWERFSYYGMTSILVLYMSHALFAPGRIDGIAGFAAFRAGLESVFGPMTPLALASQTFGLYTGFVYFTPVFGGWIADRFIGRRRAVMTGAVLMSGGHIAMAFDVSFLLALLLLITGCGLLKGNISAQVGTLYPLEDREGRTRGFSIFSMAINVGAICGPLVIGLLGDRLGWHWGFGTAGALMLIALATYSAGYRHLPADPRRKPAEQRTPLTAHEWRVVGALAVTMALTVFQSIAYYQSANIGLIWIDAFVDRDLFGFRVPVAWFNSVDPTASVIFVPILFALWDWRDKRRGHTNGNELARIGTGAWIAAAANALLAVVCLFQGAGRVSLIFPMIAEVLLGIAFLYYWPTLLALVSRTAPARINATMMGTCFLSIFIANNLIGWIGGFYEQMSPASFWALHAGIAMAGALLVMIFSGSLSQILDGKRVGETKNEP